MDHTPDDHEHDGPVLPPARSVATDDEPTLAPRLPSATPGSEPTLPPSAPTASPSPMFPEAASAPTDRGAAPFLPAAKPIAAPAAEPLPFDAKAMVESQKRFKADPTYGPMPKGTEEGREAARQLREQANRKRRRAKAVSRVVALVVLAGLAVGGWFGYQAYQDRQDDEPDVVAGNPDAPAGENGADADSGDGAPPGAGLTPLGVISEQLQAQDAVNSGARTGIGGYLDSIDDARTVVDDVNDRSEDIADLTETPIIRGEEATLPGTVPTRLDVVVTRFDLSTASSTVAQHLAADVAGDTYLSITSTADQVLAATETTADTYYQYDAGAGTLASATRGDASLRPGPDGLFVAPVTAAAIFPPEAVLHATAIDVPVTDATGADLVTTGYVIDIEGFTSAERQAAEDWLALLTGADPARVPSIAPGTVSDGEATPATASGVAAAAEEVAGAGDIDASAAPVPEPGQAVVAWRLADNGFVSDLYVHLADGSAHWLYQVDDFDPPPFAGPLLAPG